MEQPAKKQRVSQPELRIRVPSALKKAVDQHLSDMQVLEPLRGHTIADAARDLIIRGLACARIRTPAESARISRARALGE